MEGWFLICATLLVVSGGAKLVDPAPTSGALAAASLPSRRWVAQGLGAVEIVVGAGAVAFGGIVGGSAVAAVYLAFAAFVTVALRRDIPIQSCGCFGRADTPPTWLHVGVNAAAGVAGVWVAITGHGGLPDVMNQQPLLGVPYLAFLGIGVFAVYLILAELPKLVTPAGKAA